MRSVPTKAVVISAEELDADLRGGAMLVVLEVDRGVHPEKADSYRTGHIPGAHFVRFEEDLVGRRTTTSGNSPLPEPADLRARFRAWGVDDDSTVVVHT
ncbi:hypothetical protein ACWD4L_47495, partial [Streptomyces sp. NPDC002596]